MNTMLLDGYTAEQIARELPSDTALDALAGFFEALSDTTRLKILSALSVSTLCVTDLSALTGLNQTTVSHQLKCLKSARIVGYKRQGKVVFYSLSDRGFPSLMNIAVGSVFGRDEPQAE